MSNFEWRRSSRLVAYFDLITTILAVVLLAGLLKWGPINYMGSYDLNEDLNVLAVIGLLLTFNITLAAMLLRATKIDGDPARALKLAKWWLSINIVFFVSSVISDVLCFALIRFMILVIVRGLFIGTVWNYVEELSVFCNNNLSNPKV